MNFGSWKAVPLEAIEQYLSLTEADEAYLKVLEAWLDMYLEMRTTK